MAERSYAHARRVADSRRVLMGYFAGEQGVRLALDLMSIDPRYAGPDHWAFAQIIAATHTEALRRADLLLADEDMSTLVDVAAPSMPDQVLRADDPLTEHGFLLFADPVPDRTGVGVVIPIHGLSWSILPEGHPVLKPAGPDTTTSVLLTCYVSTAEYAEAIGVPLPPGAPRLIPNATVVWQIGTEIGSAFGQEAQVAGANPGFYQRLAAAFWTLARQPLAEASSAPEPTRKDRARYARAGIERPGQPVRVIGLRHRPTSGERGAPTGRHLSVRYAVRGHWRNAWRPSVQDHRMVYVAPHIRGPEGAPLLGGEKVLLVRGDSPAPSET